MTQPLWPRIRDQRCKSMPSFVGLIDEGTERSWPNLLEGAVQIRPRLRILREEQYNRNPTTFQVQVWHLNYNNVLCLN